MQWQNNCCNFVTVNIYSSQFWVNTPCLIKVHGRHPGKEKNNTVIFLASHPVILHSCQLKILCWNLEQFLGGLGTE
jgi:hypothetical protein